jgi:hypothetical protein
MVIADLLILENYIARVLSAHTDEA